MTCTKTGPKNDLFFNCQTKTKELSKKELSNVTPASLQMSHNFTTLGQAIPDNRKQMQTKYTFLMPKGPLFDKEHQLPPQYATFTVY